MSSNDSWKNSQQRQKLLSQRDNKTLEQMIMDKIEFAPLSLRDLQNQLRNNSPSRTISQRTLLKKIENSSELSLYQSHVPLKEACISKLGKVRYVGLSRKIEEDLSGEFENINYLPGTHYVYLNNDANGRI
ncbi:MAG: hypothetical protein VW298_01730 [Candidatus Woesearchaeota archaeon]